MVLFIPWRVAAERRAGSWPRRPRPIFFFAYLGGGAAIIMLSRPAAPDDAIRRRRFHFDVVGWWPGRCGGVCQRLKIAAAPLSELEDHSALNLHRKGVRDSHVCASRARARRSRLAAQLAWPAELRGRGRRPPDRDSMMVAFGRVLALDFGLARWCSLSLGAWLPSAAPDHGRAGRGRFSFLRIWVAAQPSSCCRDPPRRMMQYGAANSILMLSGGGLAGAAASVNA